jgi:hypothetical protein
MMFPSRATAIVALLAAAVLTAGCTTNDRYQYSNKQRYKKTSIGRQPPKPAAAEENLSLMTKPSEAPTAVPPAVPAMTPASTVPDATTPDAGTSDSVLPTQ